MGTPVGDSITLADLERDPDQMHNVAGEASYADAQSNLADRLDRYLTETSDPREVGGEMKWEGAEYFAKRDMTPEPSPEAIEALGLKERYTY